MKKPAFYILILLTVTTLQSQDLYPQLINSQNRQSFLLDGQWKYIVDPMENGYYNYRYLPNENGYFKNQKPQSKSDLVEYDFDRSDEIHVPGDWNTQKENLFFYEGTLWYKKSFTYKRKEDKRVFLYFGAVNYDAKVYLNGQKLGEHEGGFTPFNFEITGLLNDGENFVVVKADNSRRLENIPTVNIDWYNYGGITRTVRVIETPKTFIRDYFIQLKKGTTNQVEGWVQLDGDVAGKTVTVSIPESKVKQTMTTNDKGRAFFSFGARLTLWSDINPKLYRVSITSGEENLQEEIGFRTIETDGKNILLNGESIFLRGISIHEIAPFTAGRVIAPEQCLTLLNWAKELGCNFVRLAHYPHNEDMVRLADRMGIMVWSEIPVYWTIQWQDPSVYANAESQLVDMINRDKNRASVILWSVANETPISEPRTLFLKKLAEAARETDPTRLITGALEGHTADGFRVLDDPFGEHLDVIGVNNYCGWYWGEPEVCPEVKWKLSYNKPMIMSELGGGALQGLHGDKEERWTEEYQDWLYQNNLKMLESIPWLRGATPWILMDFLSARRPHPELQNYFNRKGLISDQGIRKQAFYTLRKYYEEKKKTFK